jgi:hypothetical protein
MTKRNESPVARRLALSQACLAACCCVAIASTAAAAPTVNRVSPRGLQTGATTTLVIDGADLLPNPRVLLSLPVARQSVKAGATAAHAEIEITLDAAASPGIYRMRVANANGVSNATSLGVDHLPELPFAPQVAALPSALNGEITGGTILRTSFSGRAGEPLVVEVESRRLGSNLNPVLHLYDARNVQLAWSQMIASIGGDARIAAKLPADGVYSVELHDVLYRGEAPGYFRLKIGQLHYADMVFPLGARRGTKTPLDFVSTNLPPESRVEADLTRADGDFPAAWPAAPWLTGARPRVVVGDLPELIETASAAPLEAPAPVAINGRLAAPRETDRYVLSVTPGQTLLFDLLAARAGSPLDGVLTIQNEAGAQLATSDDRENTTDPGLDFKVPDGVHKIVAVVSDLLGRGGGDYVYRLTVDTAGRPDFTLALDEDRHHVPRGGAELVRVRANRSGYNGPIKLSMAGLPAGVTLVGDEIPAGASEALLSLAAADASPEPALVSISGASTDPAQPLRRVALFTESQETKQQPWLRSELAVAVTAASPLAVAWEADSAGTQLPLSVSLPARIHVTRAAGAAGPVRLSLITSQSVPKKKDKDKSVDDLAKALRLAVVPTIAANESEATARILVPADLPNIPYDLAFKAELLSGNKKTVLATAVTGVRRMTSAQPFSIELVGEAKVQATAGSGETGKLVGKVHRLPSFGRGVTVTLAGLPPELPAPTVEVAADQGDFALPVAFPFGTPPAELAKVVLVANSHPGLGSSVKSNEVPVAVKIVSGGPPPALYRLFEDEPSFVAQLNEGGGKASLEADDRYAGQAALRVAPDQRFRSRLPGLGVKIVEKPGEGEYRYLRFAWKKKGGGSVLLQLNANGAWGPKRGEKKPSYRYEAGPANSPLDAEAIKVDAKLPEGWTVVTRDLFADFGAFELDGLAFTPGDGEYALFDHLYLARSEEDLKGCTAPLATEKPLRIFEDQKEFLTNLNQGAGDASLIDADKYSGAVSAKIGSKGRFNPKLPGLNVKIRQNPAPGEYRYLQFAWKKRGGKAICLQLAHEGIFGPTAEKPAKFRYDAGNTPNQSFGAALRLDKKLPNEWVVVTRDVFKDFGEFTLTGLALSPRDGNYALFDHIYLGRTVRDFEQIGP